MRILLAHTSLSGNTRDVARAIHARCEEMGHTVTWIDADIQSLAEKNGVRFTLLPASAQNQNRGQNRFSRHVFRNLSLH